MTNQKQTRWKQRYANLSKAYKQLAIAIEQFNSLSDLEKEGMVQRFEYTFELAWKTLKDYLESKGVLANFPRDVIKEAFSAEIISDGETWIEMLDKRNLMSHTYEEEVFISVVQNIYKRYFGAISQLINYLEKEL